MSRALEVSKAELAGLIDERRAAEILRLSVRTIQQARRDDLLAASALLPAPTKIGGRVFYSKTEVQEALRQRMACPRLRKKYDKREYVPNDC